MNRTVLASGGLVFRAADDGFEILAVHRPRYDDWSLPKGKDDPGETPQQAATREVMEETGQLARIVAPLPEVRYQLENGHTKVVRFFAMRPVGEGSFEPGSEVDEVRWVTAREAASLLTYQRDRDLVDRARFAAWSLTGMIYLIRHAAAGNRSGWNGDDRLRPLTTRGVRQAGALAGELAAAGLDTILSSPYVRCRQTVDPLADRTGVAVQEVGALEEGADPRATWGLVEHLAGRSAVLCSHGDVIPAIIDDLARRGAELSSPSGLVECQKASVWEISVVEGEWVRATYRPPPV